MREYMKNEPYTTADITKYPQKKAVGLQPTKLFSKTQTLLDISQIHRTTAQEDTGNEKYKEEEKLATGQFFHPT